MQTGSGSESSLLRPMIAFVRRVLAEQPARFSLVVVTLGLAGLLEGLGIATLVPILEILASRTGTGAGAGAADAAQAGTFGLAVAGVLETLRLPFTLASVLGLVLAILVVQQAVILAQQKLASGSVYRFEASLRSRLYSDIFSARWPFFVSHKAGDITNALSLEATRAAYVYEGISFMLGSAAVIVVYAALALLLSWQMTLVVLGTGLFVMFLLRHRASRSAEYGREITATNADLQSEALENVAGAKLIKGCGAEATAIARFDQFVHHLSHQLYKNRMNQMTAKVLYDVVGVVVIVLGIYFAVERFDMSVANLVVFIFIFYRLSPRLSQLQSALHTVQSFLPAVEVIDRLASEARAMTERRGGAPFADISDGIELEDVTFEYSPGHPVIQDVSLRIPRGSTVAIVGPSGSGKTTIVDLLMGLLEPCSGSVLVDGEALSDLDLHSWRNRIGYVAQDAVFFHASVLDNVVWARGDVSEERVRAAVAFANASEFIERLPKGYSTIIGDRGVALSGGQRQRLALARAILREPEVLILDEATSALDAESEEKIQAAIDRIAESVTLVIVTHRLATVRNADHIYFLEAGRIVEQGSWDELRAAAGRFEELRALQELST